MTYFPHKPIRNLFSLHSEMGRIFGDVFESREGSPDAENTTWAPTVDVAETEASFEIRAELPGVTQEDVKVSVKENLLTISGEKRQEKTDDTENYRRIERRYGNFQRTFTLPPKVKADAIKAEFREGVLTVAIPKAEEAKPTEIPITGESPADAPQQQV